MILINLLINIFSFTYKSVRIYYILGIHIYRLYFALAKYTEYIYTVLNSSLEEFTVRIYIRTLSLHIYYQSLYSTYILPIFILNVYIYLLL